MNDPEFVGQYFLPVMLSLDVFEKSFSEPSPDGARFVIETKDGQSAGYISHFKVDVGGGVTWTEIAYGLAPEHRRKGYCTEAIALMVDYLFLSKEIERVQAMVMEENIGSKLALEKNGFTKEGVLRRLAFFVGRYWDITVYSILRSEWKSPKILPYTRK